jgi:hypothetical protein
MEREAGGCGSELDPRAHGSGGGRGEESRATSVSEYVYHWVVPSQSDVHRLRCAGQGVHERLVAQLCLARVLVLETHHAVSHDAVLDFARGQVIY